MSFEWDDSLLTGDKEIDTHHRAFFVKAQRFMVATELGRGAELVESNLDFLDEYARHHFAAEEQRMDASSFPYANSHKEAHAKFLVALERFRGRLESGEDTEKLAEEVATFVVEWFRRHIKNADFPLIEHLRAGS